MFVLDYKRKLSYVYLFPFVVESNNVNHLDVCLSYGFFKYTT